MNIPLKISPIISRQLPEFIREDHPNFVLFLQAYYEWLETTYSTISPLDIGSIGDVDANMDEFIDSFRSQYLTNFPKNLAKNVDGTTVSMSNLVKNIKQFYNVKGTEASFKFLFRTIFGVDVSTYLPKDDIFVASGSNYIQQISIKVTNNIGTDIFNAVGMILNQVDKSNNTIKATARCERVIRYREGIYDVAELFVASVAGFFEPGFPIEFTFDGKIYTERSTYSVVQSVNVTEQGTGYTVGDSVVITGSTGSGAIGEVSRVGNFGEVKSVRMINSGVNYRQSDDDPIEVEFIRNDPFSLSNLIYNGSFELGDFSSTTSGLILSLTSAIQNLFGWQIINEVFIGFRNPFTNDSAAFLPFEGRAAISLGGTIQTERGGLQQTIQTIPGREYIFKFAMTSNPQASADFGVDITRFVRATAGVVSEEFSTTILQGVVGYNWKEYQFPFTATSASTVIKLEHSTPLRDGVLTDLFFYPLVDSFSVVPVAETDAEGEVVLGAINRYQGFYESEKGHISTNKVLQDNVYYQAYSYVLKSELTISKYKDVIKNLVHPAGFGMFGAVNIERNFRAELSDQNYVRNVFLPLLGNYTPYTFQTFVSLDEAYPDGYQSPITGEILSSPGNPLGFPFWPIFSHPNSQNIPGIDPNISFKNIKIRDFISYSNGYNHQSSELSNVSSISDG